MIYLWIILSKNGYEVNLEKRRIALPCLNYKDCWKWWTKRAVLCRKLTGRFLITHTSVTFLFMQYSFCLAPSRDIIVQVKIRRGFSSVSVRPVVQSMGRGTCFTFKLSMISFPFIWKILSKHPHTLWIQVPALSWFQCQVQQHLCVLIRRSLWR